MRTGRPKVPIMLSDQEHEQLTSMVRSRSNPNGLVTRARIVLLAAEGATTVRSLKRPTLENGNNFKAL